MSARPAILLPVWGRQTLEQVLYARELIVLQKAAVIVVPGTAHRTALGLFLVPVVQQYVVWVRRAGVFSLQVHFVPLDSLLVHHREKCRIFLLEAEQTV